VGNTHAVILRISSLLCTSAFLSTRTKKFFSVTCVSDGPLSPLFSTTSSGVMIDSGYRMGTSYPLLADGGSPDLLKRPFNASRSVRTGSKIFLFTPRLTLLMVKERPGKKWDFVGGHVDPGETPWECISREAKEEVGLDLDRASCLYLGVSTAFGFEEVVISHIFLGFTDVSAFHPPSPSELREISYSDLETINVNDYAEWVPRHREWILSSVGSFASVIDTLSLKCNLPFCLGKEDPRFVVATLLIQAINNGSGCLYYTHFIRSLSRVSPQSIGMDILAYFKFHKLVEHVLSTDVLVITGSLSQYLEPSGVRVRDLTPPVEPPDVPLSPVISDFDAEDSGMVLPPVLPFPGAVHRASGGLRAPGRTLTFEEQQIITFVSRMPGCSSQQIKRSCGPLALTLAYKMPELQVVSHGAEKQWSVVSVKKS